MFFKKEPVNPLSADQKLEALKIVFQSLENERVYRGHNLERVVPNSVQETLQILFPNGL